MGKHGPKRDDEAFLAGEYLEKLYATRDVSGNLLYLAPNQASI
jgi:hypothetical protein